MFVPGQASVPGEYDRRLDRRKLLVFEKGLSRLKLVEYRPATCTQQLGRLNSASSAALAGTESRRLLVGRSCRGVGLAGENVADSGRKAITCSLIAFDLS